MREECSKETEQYVQNQFRDLELIQHGCCSCGEQKGLGKRTEHAGISGTLDLPTEKEIPLSDGSLWKLPVQSDVKGSPNPEKGEATSFQAPQPNLA